MDHPRNLSPVIFFHLEIILASISAQRYKFIHPFIYLDLDTKSFCDIGFLLDTSGSISRDSYILEKEFVANIAERLSISENGNHYGVVLFGAYANVEIPFNRYFDLSTFQRAVLSMPQSGSITRIDRGLYKVYSELFRDKRDHRENAKKILFLLTDGEQSIGSDVLNNKLIADTLRYTGVSLIIIGVGSDVKPEDLLKIDENVYLARNFEELISDTFYKKLNISCCKYHICFLQTYQLQPVFQYFLFYV